MDGMIYGTREAQAVELRIEFHVGVNISARSVHVCVSGITAGHVSEARQLLGIQFVLLHLINPLPLVNPLPEPKFTRLKI